MPAFSFSSCSAFLRFDSAASASAFCLSCSSFSFARALSRLACCWSICSRIAANTSSLPSKAPDSNCCSKDFLDFSKIEISFSRFFTWVAVSTPFIALVSLIKAPERLSTTPLNKSVIPVVSANCSFNSSVACPNVSSEPDNVSFAEPSPVPPTRSCSALNIISCALALSPVSTKELIKFCCSDVSSIPFLFRIDIASAGFSKARPRFLASTEISVPNVSAKS